ncbi:unnamed protein product [Brassica rapa subsp. narinosa]|uniref:(rape) hypothetical protein n=1 Tax=Brassica napus TaxID=3708 RepID=A0A817AVI9_BRANA|nr:unnamed protein product [Brassica napus]
MAPACRSPYRFPGSKKAMLIRKPGPVNSHSFRHEKGGAAAGSPADSKSTITILSRDSNAASDSDSDSSSSELEGRDWGGGRRRSASSTFSATLTSFSIT